MCEDSVGDDYGGSSHRLLVLASVSLGLFFTSSKFMYVIDSSFVFRPRKELRFERDKTVLFYLTRSADPCDRAEV